MKYLRKALTKEKKEKSVNEYFIAVLLLLYYLKYLNLKKAGCLIIIQTEVTLNSNLKMNIVTIFKSLYLKMTKLEGIKLNPCSA